MGRTRNVRVVSPRNLRGFDKEARRIIRKALDEGWEGRISTGGHAIMRHPDGRTISISRDMSDSHTRMNAEADVLQKTTRVSKSRSMST